MNRMLTVVAVVLAGTLTAAVANAGQSQHQMAGHWKKVTVVRAKDVAGERMHIGAMKDSRGSFGFAMTTFPGRFHLTGRVTCYEVVASNVTRVGIRITSSQGAEVGANKGFMFYLEDNGTSGSQGDIIGTGFLREVPRTCGHAQGGATPFQTGDVRIRN